MDFPLDSAIEDLWCSFLDFSTEGTHKKGSG